MTPPTTPARKAPRQRGAFSLRQTALVFALAATLLCGTGLALKAVARNAGEHRGYVYAAGLLVVIALIATVRRTRTRTRPRPRPRARTRTRTARPLREPMASVPGPRRQPDHPEPEPEPEAVPAPESTPESTAEMFGAMDPLVFEQAIAELCVRDGCQDVEVSGGAGDLGADVTGLTPDGRRLVVQCKRYGPVNKVGSQDMQRFGGTCFAVHQAEVAVLVTTGEFTGPAAEYADECGILRYDSEALTAWADATGPAPWEADHPAPQARSAAR
ncbi:restriction endonuclease [Streptomyces uncialis]|uniref:restriction endonuclease n=1 Tax=Streptomyces uncialis TaxID=1048205 RepID=UPI002257D583|nr:restriction endonuclease [Streptomyces uncialis]MCX4661882.1 restriction endonuclease [Streptomyces uncialis]